MFYSLITAFSIAILIGITPGAALFSILKTSLSRGFKAGCWQAFGISMSDITIVALCVCGLAQFMEDNITVRLITSIIGGCILIIYGGYAFLNKDTDLNPKRKNKIEGRIQNKNFKIEAFKYFATGFSFNFTNPFVWILWLGMVPYSGITLREQIVFFFTALATIFCFDLCKSFFANKIKNILTPTNIYWANRISGLLICILGIGLIIKTMITIV